MRSRVTREYFMPTWPMAMPSHTAMAGNSTGVPPAARTPNGRTFFNSKRAQLKKHQMEIVGSELRKNMIWGGDRGVAQGVK